MEDELERILKDIKERENVEIEHSHSFKYCDVNYLEIEVLKMPITSLNHDFLWRFSKPFNGILNIKPIKIFNLTNSDSSIEKELKKILLEEWKNLVKLNCSEEERVNPKTKEMINKWENITEVRIKYLKLVVDTEENNDVK